MSTKTLRTLLIGIAFGYMAERVAVKVELARALAQAYEDQDNEYTPPVDQVQIRFIAHHER